MMKIYLKFFISVVVFAFVLSGCTRLPEKKEEDRVKNVIFMIGDGMGLAQVSAAMIAADRPLQMERARYVGVSKTYSYSNKITDSAAAATALATGEKTNNGKIGIKPDGSPVPTLLERASDTGYATGIVATYSITNATPAGFLSHVEHRSMEEDIASQIIHSGVDVCFGGGKQFFMDRSDKRNLVDSLTKKQYQVIFEQEKLDFLEKGRVIGLFADNAMPGKGYDRGDFLPRATTKALDLLHGLSKKGFFIMVEGSQIDGAGHANDITAVLNETLDFDEAVGVAFDFADKYPGTLVVVTADHETGGLYLRHNTKKEELPDQEIAYGFGSGNHTAVMVPIFAYGTGAERFSRVLDNTDLPKIMSELLGLSID